MTRTDAGLVAICATDKRCRTCTEVAQFTRDLVGACKNDAMGKVGGESNHFPGFQGQGDVYIQLWHWDEPHKNGVHPSQ